MRFKEPLGLPIGPNENYRKAIQPYLDEMLPGLDTSEMVFPGDKEDTEEPLKKFPSFARHHKVKANGWLIEKLIVDPGLTMFAGRPESGKSLLITLALACVGRGQPFAGLATTKPSRFSLIVDTENGMAEMIRRGKAFELQHLHTVRFWCMDNPSLPLPPKDPLDPAYVEIAERHRCPITFDPLSYFTDGKLNRPEDVVPVVQKFKELASRYRIPVILSHHSSDKDEANQYLGSTLIRSVLDAGHFVELTTDPENEDRQHITLSSMKARRTNRITFGIEVDWEQGTYEPWTSQREKDAQKALEMAKAGLTERRIAAKLGKSRKYVRRLLGRL